MSELQGLQLSHEEFRKLGARVAAICVDPPERNAEVVRQHGLDFPILADVDRSAVRAFGVLHEDGFRGQDIARPATFIAVDGRVRWSSLTGNYRVRPQPETLLEVVRGLTGG